MDDFSFLGKSSIDASEDIFDIFFKNIAKNKKRIIGYKYSNFLVIIQSKEGTTAFNAYDKKTIIEREKLHHHKFEKIATFPISPNRSCKIIKDIFNDNKWIDDDFESIIKKFKQHKEFIFLKKKIPIYKYFTKP